MMDKLLCHKNRQSSTDDQSIVGWRSFVIPITIEIIIFICPLLVRFVRYMSPTGDLDGPGFHHCRANELTITCRCASTNIYVLIWFLCSMNNEEGLLLSYHLASTKPHSHCSPKFIHLWLLSSSPCTSQYWLHLVVQIPGLYVCIKCSAPTIIVELLFGDRAGIHTEKTIFR